MNTNSCTTINRLGSTILECPNPQNFDKVFRERVSADSSGSSVYLLFTGSKSESTGLSWCPDCVRAEPIIHEAFGGLEEKASLVVFPLEREFYRSPDCPLRKDPRVLLRCVPTLMKWENGVCSMRLNDIQCQSKAAVEEFMKFA